MNVVTLIGNLATGVELKEVGAGKRVASFVLAVDRPLRDGGADLVHICAWGKQAELCDRFLARGKRVALDGRLRSRSWRDTSGNTRSAVEVVANRIEFLSAPETAGEAEAEAPFEEAPV